MPTVETDADKRLANYVGELSLRWSESFVVPRIEVEQAGWQPVVKQCHRNVAELVKLNDDYQPVRGWMIMDLRESVLLLNALFGLEQEPRIELLAHSIVKNKQGKLLDVTPVEALYGTPNEYPFLQHVGDEDEYATFIEN